MNLSTCINLKYLISTLYCKIPPTPWKDLHEIYGNKKEGAYCFEWNIWQQYSSVQTWVKFCLFQQVISERNFRITNVFSNYYLLEFLASNTLK